MADSFDKKIAEGRWDDLTEEEKAFGERLMATGGYAPAGTRTVWDEIQEEVAIDMAIDKRRRENEQANRQRAQEQAKRRRGSVSA